MSMAEKLLALHADSPLLVALFDEQDVLRHANAAFCQVFQVRAEEALSFGDLMRRCHAQGVGTLIETQDIEAWLASVGSRRGKLAFRAFEADLCDGRWIWVSETKQPGGWLLSVSSDISALRQASGSLRQAPAKALTTALTDGLTGLSNRRHGLQLLQAALTHSSAWPLCVVMVDLDQLQRINDPLGDAAGDRVICDFARQVQAAIRREDGCARLVGDEFLLIFPTAALPQASSVIERLLARVRRSRPLDGRPALGYTASAGLVEAVWGEAAEDLLIRAAAALQAAKTAGGDRLSCAPQAVA